MMMVCRERKKFNLAWSAVEKSSFRTTPNYSYCPPGCRLVRCSKSSRVAD
jgi:hypothetical protein